MKVLFSICIGVVLAIAFSLDAFAQEVQPKTINGGIINGKAISLPKPVYPDQAREARLGGVAGINVIIDETGSVVFAEADINDQRERKAADGTRLEAVPLDPNLREAAETAALQAKFSPTTLGGQPVRVKGKILYNFVVDNSDQPARVGDINGPLLNGKAIYLPKPAYPEPAKAVKAQGEVTVHVRINEDGTVASATAVSGHPLLRAAAEAAAREAKFSPTLISEQPVNVAGVVTYKFVLPKTEEQ